MTAGPAQRVPGAGGPRAGPGRRAAAVHHGDRRRRGAAAGRPADGARRDRRAARRHPARVPARRRGAAPATSPSERPRAPCRRLGRPARSGSSAPGCSAPASAWRCAARGVDVDAGRPVARPRPRWRATSVPGGLVEGADDDRRPGRRRRAAGRRRRTSSPPSSPRYPRRRRHRRRERQGRPAARRAGQPAPTCAATSAATRMAGRERSGAVAARGDLFAGRPWVLTPTRRATRPPLAAVRQLAVGRRRASCRAWTPTQHDEAVALVVARAAGRRQPGRRAAAEVAARPPSRWPGRALRDVTRIAASDPALWTQILAGNARGRVAACCSGAAGRPRRRLSTRSTRWPASPADGAGAAGSRAAWRGLVARATQGHARIPGKHGARTDDVRRGAGPRAGPPGRAGPAAHGRRRGRHQPRGPAARAQPGPAGRAWPRSPSCRRPRRPRGGPARPRRGACRPGSSTLDRSPDPRARQQRGRERPRD